MGLLGRYLGALSDEQRDRIIEANAMITGNYLDDNGTGCLVGVAEGADEQPIAEGVGEKAFDLVVEFSFDELCDRFGKDRIVAACKARAARGNAPTVTEIRAKVYRELVPVGGMSGWVRDLL